MQNTLNIILFLQDLYKGYNIISFTKDGTINGL